MALSPEAFFGFDGSRVHFVRGKVEVSVDCAHEDWIIVRERWEEGDEERALGAFGSAEQELRDALSMHRLLRRDEEHRPDLGPPGPGEPQLVRLTELMGLATLPPEPMIALTSTEALWLPDTVDTETRRLALRLFVSGLGPECRLRCYGQELATGEATVLQDAPSPEASSRAVRLLGELEVPTALHLSSGVTTRLGECPGRLHVAQALTSMPLYSSAAPFHLATAEFACPNLRFQGDEARRAWGMSTDPELARIKAVGEAVERFASGDIRPNSLLTATADELDGPHLDPGSIVAYSKRQHQEHTDLRPFLPTDRNLWGRAEAGDGKEIYVLADLLFYPFARPFERGWQAYATTTSSGVAAHPDPLRAKELALLELVERDAFMRVWLSRQSPPRLRSPKLGADADAFLDELHGKGWEVVLLSIGTEAVPVILAVATREGEVIVGSCAGEPRDGAVKAVTELVSCLSPSSGDSPRDPEDVEGPEDHQSLFRDRRFAPRTDFLRESERLLDLEDLPTCDLSALKAKGVFYRLPRCAGVEVEVWRALVPGLIPISFGWDREPLGLPEVQAELRRAGESPEGPLFPHPFS